MGNASYFRYESHKWTCRASQAGSYEQAWCCQEIVPSSRMSWPFWSIQCRSLQSERGIDIQNAMTTERSCLPPIGAARLAMSSKACWVRKDWEGVRGCGAAHPESTAKLSAKERRPKFRRGMVSLTDKLRARNWLVDLREGLRADSVGNPFFSAGGRT